MKSYPRQGLYITSLEKEIYNALRDAWGDVFVKFRFTPAELDFIKDLEVPSEGEAGMHLRLTLHDAKLVERMADEWNMSRSKVFKKFLRFVMPDEFSVCLKRVLAHAKLNYVEVGLALCQQVSKMGER